MDEKHVNQRSILFLDLDDHLEVWIEKFLIDRKVEGFTTGTLEFYKTKLTLLARYCQTREITRITQVDANEIRGLLQWLEDTGHNPGGRSTVYRAAKTFIRWWSNETEPENWRDPFKKVKGPKLSKEPLDPVELETVKLLLATCKVTELIGARDYAIFYFLIDTGVRASELLSIELQDLDMVFGSALIRQGKGRKSRSVFFGKSTKKAIKRYLNLRHDKNPSLWITQELTQLTYWGLTIMLKHRSQRAGIKAPRLHDFRRAFALGMLRNGVDIYTLQRLMGHADLQVLRVYLAQTDEDLATAHRKYGLADRL